MEHYSAKHYDGSPVSLMIYVEDVDSAAKNAVAIISKPTGGHPFSPFG
ncbi:MAG TPA: hypothetical protein VGM27_10125 [Acidobacteriaceae bacterium]